ncbi:MAG: PTS glucose transporter subunit IIA [Acholeplasmataceae bacterium]
MMKIDFYKPIKGEYLDISEASDDVFSQKLLGPGFLVNPCDQQIFSPIHGKIKMIYPTHHALAISNNDYDILIHVGLSDMLRDQSLFDLHVAIGDEVNIGDLLLTLNINFNDYNLIDYQTPIIFVQKKHIEVLKETKDNFELILY